jgi:hypothetical protein
MGRAAACSARPRRRRGLRRRGRDWVFAVARVGGGASGLARRPCGAVAHVLTENARAEETRAEERKGRIVNGLIPCRETPHTLTRGVTFII